jgi:hypothetical protein
MWHRQRVIEEKASRLLEGRRSVEEGAPAWLSYSMPCGAYWAGLHQVSRIASYSEAELEMVLEATRPTASQGSEERPCFMDANGRSNASDAGLDARKRFLPVLQNTMEVQIAGASLKG